MEGGGNDDQHAYTSKLTPLLNLQFLGQYQ